MKKVVTTVISSSKRQPRLKVIRSYRTPSLLKKKPSSSKSSLKVSTLPAEDLEGVFCPIVTPFSVAITKPRDSFPFEAVDFERISDNVHQLIDQYPLKGLVVLGTTGEAASLTKSEKFGILELVAYETKQRKLSSKSPNKERGLQLIAGTGDNSVEDVIELSNYAANIGYQYALIKPPFYYKNVSNEGLKEFYSTVSKRLMESSIKIILYNIPQNTGIDLFERGHLLEDLCRDNDNIIGIKQSVPSIVSFTSMISLKQKILQDTQGLKDFVILSGNGSVFNSAILSGVDGGILALANVFPGECWTIWELANQGDIFGAQELQRILLPVNEAITTKFGISGCKFAMEMMGFGWQGKPRVPLNSLTIDQMTELSELLKDTVNLVDQFKTLYLPQYK